MPRDRGLRLDVGGTELVVTTGALGQLAALGLFVGLAGGPSTWTSWAAPLALATVACSFLSVAVHEAGHAVVASLLGLDVRRIEVRGVLHGAVRRTTSPDPRADVAVCLAGPAASALLVVLGAALWAWTGPAPLVPALRTLAGTSALALASSLLPVAGSDGTRALEAWRRRSRIPSTPERRASPASTCRARPPTSRR